MVRHFVIPIFLLFGAACHTQPTDKQVVRTGADQTDRYLSKLEGKNVGLFANHTSVINQTHLTDSLISLGVNITQVFSPEHGFKGNQPDGEVITEEAADSFELVSLYGSSKKPTDAQVQDLDILIVDIQDVGVRCYTYASTMTYLMEACAKNDVPMLLLDRPNPNSYVDGPVLEEAFKSFVGLHPIPLVHGLTLGELALMINGEGWLKDSLLCELEVIQVKNWNHRTAYALPMSPSPNLPNDLSISLYPSLVLFEGTVVSVGRGTDWPFQVIGHPEFAIGSFTFTPAPNPGSKYPPLEGQQCFGTQLTQDNAQDSLDLSLLISYHDFLQPRLEKPFFNDYFTQLAGTDQLQKQIEAGWSEAAIRQSWQKDLDKYRKIREQYLLYDDL